MEGIDEGIDSCIVVASSSEGDGKNSRQSDAGLKASLYKGEMENAE